MSEQDDTLIAIGGSIKALGDGKVGGHLVVFTDENDLDLEGEYFDSDTDYAFEDGDPSNIYYHHGADPTISLRKLGRGFMKMDGDVGVWIEGQLDLRDAYERAIYKMAEDGALDWSSGTLAHLTQREARGKGMYIKSWPLGGDATMTPTPAAGPSVTRVMTLKAYKQMAETDTEQETAPEIAKDSDSAAVTDGDGDAGNSEMENRKMTEEAKVEQVEQPEIDYGKIGDIMASKMKPLEDRLETLEKQEEPAPEAVKNVNVVTDTEHWKYDNIDSGDLAVMVGVLESAKQSGRSRGGASVGAYKALAHRLESEEADKREPLQVARHSYKMAGIKANEINQSTLASYGDEWVGVAYSGQLWESIRHATFVLNRLPSLEVPQGAESITIPLESTDPTWYKVSQAANLSANPGGIPTNTVTASNLGTANVSLTLGKMGARVLWTGEMEEDAVLPYVAQLQRQLAVSGAEYLEHVLIDGDTATGATTNINDIGGTPGGTEAFLILNGFRKSPLVTTTANSRDGGALAVEDFIETVKLMGDAGKNALDREKVSFIIDPSTHYKSLELNEIKTQDVFSGAVLEAGQLHRIYGYEVLLSAHMAKGSGTGLTSSAGKVDLDTTSNNAYGQILAVRWDQWQFGWRRRMTIETTRVPAADSTEIVSLMRFGMIQRDTEAAAISYNLTV